jgi:hypothetical protein
MDSFCGIPDGPVVPLYATLITAYCPRFTRGSTGVTYTDAIVISALNIPAAQNYTGFLSQENDSRER